MPLTRLDYTVINGLIIVQKSRISAMPIDVIQQELTLMSSMIVQKRGISANYKALFD